MALNRNALQHELDLAAEELDRIGQTDLADKVDRYSTMLGSAKDADIPMIHRGLCRIQAEYERRTSKKQKPKPAAIKAQAAVLSARRSSIQRKIAIKRLLRERAAVREKQSKKIQAVTQATKQESPVKNRLHQRISQAEKEVQAAKHRVDRLRRIQSRLN
jgi:hypothetical protein